MDLKNLTDKEVTTEFWRRCPPELRAKIDRNLGQSDAEALVAALAQEMTAALGKEWCDAIGEREFRKEVMRVLAEPTPIVELLPQTPHHLQMLELPFTCSTENLSPTNRRLTGWENATWSDIEAQRRILAEDRAWWLLDNVQHLSRAVEPFMREHPARTLAEVMPLLSRQEEEQR